MRNKTAKNTRDEGGGANIEPLNEQQAVVSYQEQTPQGQPEGGGNTKKDEKNGLFDWIKTAKDGYEMYEKYGAVVKDLGTTIQTAGANHALEAAGAFALALAKGWEPEKCNITGPEEFKAAWAEEMEKYKEKLKTQAQEPEKIFGVAWETASDGLEYGVEYEEIIKMAEEKGVPTEMAKDALALDLLNRDMEINIPDTEIEKMTHEKAKEHINAATTKLAEAIKQTVYEPQAAKEQSASIER